MRTHRQTPYLVLVAAVAMILSLLSGCSSVDVEQYRNVRDELQAALDLTKAELEKARQTIAELTTQIALLDDGPEKQAALEARDHVQGVIDKGEAVIPQLEEGIARANQAIEAAIAGDTAAAVNAIGTYVGSKAPPPWNVYILAGTTVLGGVLSYIQKRKKDELSQDNRRKIEEISYLNEERQSIGRSLKSTEQAARSVIKAIEYEKGGDGVVNFDDPATKMSLRSRMSTEARELVEQTQREVQPRVTTLKAVTSAPAKT